jgi:hypothetical protein
MKKLIFALLLLASSSFAQTSQGPKIFSGTTATTFEPCVVPSIFIDTDATTGQRVFACEGTTFVLQGDGGAGGGGAPTTAQYLTLALDGTLSAERTFAIGVGLDTTDAGANGSFTIDMDLTELTCGIGVLCSGATTFSVDTTEIGSTTWGSGSGFTHTFNAGAVDPTITFGSNSVTWGGLTSMTLPAASTFSITSGCTFSTLLDCAASAATGGAILIREDSSFGTDTWQIWLDQTDLAAPFNITPLPSGLLQATQLLHVTATDRVLCRDTAGAGAVEECTAAATLEWMGTTQGQLLYRGNSAWTPLAVGTAGQVLTTGGAGANPSWRSTPVYKTFLAAACNVTSPSPGFNIPTANGPSASCYGTAPDSFGGLDFADGANVLTSEFSFKLKDWDGAAISIDLTWFCGVGTCSTAQVAWSLQAVCVADAENYNNPTYNAAEVNLTAGSATQYNRITTTDSSLDITGCAAGETFKVQISRDPTNGSDTFAATAVLLEATIKYGVL